MVPPSRSGLVTPQPKHADKMSMYDRVFLETDRKIETLNLGASWWMNR
jgi:hypothetical protein